HDAVLDRATDVEGRIRDLTWGQVSQARIHGRSPILRLTELLSEFPATRFNLDIKESNAIDPFLDVIRTHNAWNRINVAAFAHERLRRVRRMAGPRLSSSMSPQEVLAFRMHMRGRLRRWSPPPVSCVQIPEHVAGRLLAEPRLISAAHEHGWQVHVWTVDDRETMNRLLDMGVDAIMTDRPTLLRDVLIARGQWTQAA
ncbi:MAG: glycerophosphodiester phosphodiesterase family protein, partial [Candidatus Nanopelagicales bacterium]|nr:glycerophosphodiester phosphodiesterase family protein [Candidatus Nanopelagicales bacterium]